MRIDVAFLPEELRVASASGVCVAVDVLRATSSIATAIANGCSGIYPVTEPSQAFPFADGETALACGERKGERISGYHLGNSPSEFTQQAVQGKQLVMCTTNGTRAIRAGASFRRTAIGCLLNAPAVVSALEEESDDVTIVCAGREGHFSIEDTLCAGMILSELDGDMSDAAVAAVSIFHQYQDRVEEILLESEHGRYLQQIGFAKDIEYCARVGIVNCVPEVFVSGKPPPYDLTIKTMPIDHHTGEAAND
jgi:2-phosphosulfolactate phosphatase